jgi:hypothetical protein
MNANSPPVSPFVPFGTVKRQVESININSKPLIEFDAEQSRDTAKEESNNDDNYMAMKQQRSPDSKRFKCGLDETIIDSDDENNNTNENSRDAKNWTDDQVVSSQENSACSKDDEESLTKHSVSNNMEDTVETDELLNSSLSRSNQFYRSKKLFEQLEDMQNVRAQVKGNRKLSDADLVKKPTKVSEIR